MKFLFSSLKYSFKNFFRLIAVAVAPAVFLGFFFKMFHPFTFLRDYGNKNITRFSHMLNATFKFSLTDAAILVAVILLLTLVFSVCLAITEFNLKTGRHDIAQEIKISKNYLLPTLFILVICSLVWLLLAFLSSAIAFLAHYLIAGLGNTPNTACYIVVCLIYIAFLVLALIAFTFLTMSLLSMLSHGHNLLSAFSAASDFLEGKVLSLVGAFGIPYVTAGLIIMFLDKAPWFVAVRILLFALLMVYYSVCAQIAFFKLSNIQRKDLKKEGYFL